MKSNFDYLGQINRCIKANDLTAVSGGFMDEFEREAAKLFGNKFGVSTCNGTSALYLALFCLSLDSGRKEVIVPAYGFHAMASVICLLGLKPVFCDVDSKTLTLDFDRCDKLINKNTLTVMVLHPWGNPANMDKMVGLKQKHKEVFFVSDSSHAHEVLWRRKPIGSYFDINCASFGLGKLISGGELGILTTDSPVFRDRALLFCHTNRVPGDYFTGNYRAIENVVGIKFRPHLFAMLLALHDIKNNRKLRLAVKNNFLSFKRQMLSETDKFFFQENYEPADRMFYMPLIGFKTKAEAEKAIKILSGRGWHAQWHKFTKILPQMNIFTGFYRLKNKRKFPHAQAIADQNMIHINSEDFINRAKTNELKKILLSLS